MRKKNDSIRLASFAVSGEMVEGRGEDSKLILISPERHVGRAVLAVFDGCGGLGARRYPSEGDASGAYIASRLAAETLKGIAIGDEISPELYEMALKVTFKRERARLDALNGEMKFRSDMVKALPTTACVATVEKNDCSVMWIGDSRLYTLDKGGLHLLTSDDGLQRGGDSYVSDSRLFGSVNAEDDFIFFSRRVSARLPRVWIVASDGFYESFRTPMEMEEFLLESLMESSDSREWREKISARAEECAGDDYTAVFLISGYPSFQTLKKRLNSRAKHVLKKNKGLSSCDGEDFEALAEEIWKDYRRSFIQY